jgi:preprotein translocase subunit SecA
MLSIISKMFGGNKSEKDVKKLMPDVEKAKVFYASYSTLSNDDLRAKTFEFKNRIKEFLAPTDAAIQE